MLKNQDGPGEEATVDEFRKEIAILAQLRRFYFVTDQAYNVSSPYIVDFLGAGTTFSFFCRLLNFLVVFPNKLCYITVYVP